MGMCNALCFSVMRDNILADWANKYVRWVNKLARRGLTNNINAKWAFAKNINAERGPFSPLCLQLFTVIVIFDSPFCIFIINIQPEIINEYFFDGIRLFVHVNICAQFQDLVFILFY